MGQVAIPAAFMRGGTSKALMLHARDLPDDRAAWDSIFLAAMGSPDPYGRQLDGMGGGVSSLSKVCVVAPSEHGDADIDYTFAQVLIREARVDYRGNCGNMSSAVGPFAVDEGLVGPSFPGGSPHRPQGGVATVRIFNTNTAKLIHACFPIDGDGARYDGDLAIPGVAGTGAPVRLDFLDPGGATTGRLLPTGSPLDRLDVEGIGSIEASLVDAANACVFVRAGDVGLQGTEMPDALDGRPDILHRLDAIRRAASVAMGIVPSPEAARAVTAVPFVAVVSPAAAFRTLTGETVPASAMDLTARVISNGQPHRALPLTISLCTAVAARITGTVPAEVLAPAARGEGPLRLGMPSGVLTVAAEVAQQDGVWTASKGSFYRTARRLFSGQVWVPAPRPGN